MGTETLNRKNICCDCVGETFLSGEIRREGKARRCFYCGSTTPCITLKNISGRVQEAFEEYYVIPNPIYEDRYRSDWGNEPGLSTDETIQLAAGVSKQVASDIQEILSEQFSDPESWGDDDENPFSSINRYLLKTTDDTMWHDDWASFEEELRTETRFFSLSAIKFLDSIFSGIEKEQTADGFPVVTTTGPGARYTDVYRARCFQSDEEFKTALERPDLHLGPPPSHKATAGRMNADGISVFYGATDPSAALAEVRPPVGSRVVVARFEIICPLQLLDLKALNDIDSSTSVFDRGNSRRLERAAFLRHLARLLAQPVLPDRQRFEYLPTQAIADYLATRVDGPLDGIVFPSVQAGGGALNLVLFHKAARVQEIERPQGTDFKVCGGYRDPKLGGGAYTVYEFVPSGEAETTPVAPTWAYAINEDRDYRKPVLRIDLDSIYVQYVKGVQFDNSDPQSVRRSRR